MRLGWRHMQSPPPRDLLGHCRHFGGEIIFLFLQPLAELKRAKPDQFDLGAHLLAEGLDHLAESSGRGR